MDYLFMIERNQQTADLNAVKNEIQGFAPSSLPYLEIDELGKGIVGIVRFAEKTTADDFFDKVRHQVALINRLPLNKLPPENKLPGSNLDPEEVPQEGPATWARASMGDVLVGFAVKNPPPPEINSDINKYEIVGTMLGGIGGKH